MLVSGRLIGHRDGYGFVVPDVAAGRARTRTSSFPPMAWVPPCTATAWKCTSTVDQGL